MVGIGDDIAEVFEELGSKITIYKHADGSTYEEYVDTDYEVNHVYPHTSHYFAKGSFAYNTAAKPGDMITFPDNDKYLLVALAKERFENEVIVKEGVLFMCNAYTEVRRKQESRVNYELQTTWPVAHSGEYVFFTGQLDMIVTETGPFGKLVLDRNLIYFPSIVDVREADRCVVRTSPNDVSGEAYEVQLVEAQRLPGIKICRVINDTRE